MGRNKFEKHLKEKLQGREIKPSEDAWDRISKQMDGSETPKFGNFRWYGIAAGFIGILFVTAMYLTIRGFNTDAETQITDVKEDTIPYISIPEIHQEQKIGEKTFFVDSEVSEEKSIQSTSRQNSEIRIKKALTSSNDKERKVEIVRIPKSTSEELIDAKIIEIVAQVALLEKENSTLTDTEIDSLLRGAQRQILEDKIFRDDESVDAMTLLADVEDELDQSFRDQIFEALKDGFLKVRTAVADRNR